MQITSRQNVTAEKGISKSRELCCKSQFILAEFMSCCCMHPGVQLLTYPNSLRAFLCQGLFYPTALSMSGDGKKGNKIISAEQSWGFMQQNCLIWKAPKKCHWEGLLPIAICSNAFQKWKDLLTRARLRVHLPHSLQLESTGYFCLLMPYQEYSRWNLFPMSAMYHVICTQ